MQEQCACTDEKYSCYICVYSTGSERNFEWAPFYGGGGRKYSKFGTLKLSQMVNLVKMVMQLFLRHFLLDLIQTYVVLYTCI